MSLTEQLLPNSEPEGQIAHNTSRIGPVYEPWHKRRAISGARRPRFPVCGEIKDVNGDLWDVRDVCDTRHGFDLCFGTPAKGHGAYRGGLPRLIATKPLWDFWDANRTKSHGFLFDLPAGRTTLKRLRRRLGFNLNDDTMDFWADHIEDLDYLPVREFALKYGVDPQVTSDWRRKFLGVRARPIGWWRKAKFRRVLLSGVTGYEAGRRLGISRTHARRLRDRVKLEAQLLLAPVSDKLRLAHEPEHRPEALVR